MKQKQTIFEGAMILTASTILVKVIGALFKVPLANILGGIGMSYFVSAYDIFTPLYSMAVTGLGIATSRRISEATTGRGETAESILITARWIFMLIGVMGFLILFFLSGLLTKAIGNTGSQLSVCLIAPSLIFSCVSASYRGYFQGKNNMLPTAKSQVLEAVVKLLVGVGLSLFLYRYLTQCYQMGNAPLWLQELEEQKARLVVLQVAAGGAVLGVTFSTFSGMLYMKYTFKRSCYCRSAPRYSSKVARSLLAIALPIAMTSVVANLTTLIDLSSVMNCLTKAVTRNSAMILNLYQNCIPPEVSIELIPEYLYGCYSGLAVSIFNLVPALTAGIGVSAIPVIALHYKKNATNDLNRSFRTILLTTAIISFPLGVGIFTMAQPILAFLYPGKIMEVSIVAPILKVMGISTILVSFSTILNNVLQATRKEKTPLLALLFGGIIKLITNFILVSRPEVNIHGVAYGTLFCYAFIVLFCVGALRSAGFRLRSVSVLVGPAIAAALCGVTAKYSFQIFLIRLGNAVSLMLAITLGAIVYFLGLFSMKCIKSADNSFTFYGRKK